MKRRLSEAMRPEVFDLGGGSAPAARSGRLPRSFSGEMKGDDA
jgi:hypothetical protein